MDEQKCRQCGEAVLASDRFCGECGVAVTVAENPEPEIAISETRTPAPQAGSGKAVTEGRTVPVLIGAAALACVVLYFSISDDNQKTAIPSESQIVESEVPAEKPESTVATAAPSLPMIRISEPANGSQKCVNFANCRAASGELSYGDMLISESDWSIFDIEISDTKHLAQRLNGRVVRTEPPPGSSNTISLILESGKLQGYVKGATITLIIGESFCEISDGSYDASYYDFNKSMRFSKSTAGARCEDSNGNLYFSSSDKPHLYLKNQ